MTQAFKLPDLGEGIHEGEVTAVLVSVGDQVKEGQPILEVETDKAEVEIPSPYTGTVTEIRVQRDDTVKVGTVLMVFGDGGEAGSRAEAAEPAPRPAAAASPTDAPPAPDKGHERAAARPAAAKPTANNPPIHGEGPVPASPATRRLARELGVKLHEVSGSGPAGLVTATDVRAFAEGRDKVSQETGAALNGQLRAAEAPPAPETEVAAEPAPVEPAGTQRASVEVPPLPDFSRWGPVERVALRSVRRATARHMTLAWSQIPHAYFQDVADVTRLEEYRRKHAAEIEAAGGKLTLTVFVAKAVVAALKQFPRVNASLDPASEEILLKRYYHLSVAVDTEKGLIVPVLRDVDRKSVTELAIELKESARRARAGEVTLEEMQGGSFTLTNVGLLGGTGFTTIVNYPQVAILGMGRARLQPVVLGDEQQYELVPRLMLPLGLGFDHRVLDGADAARFVRTVIEALEEPDRLWLRI